MVDTKELFVDLTEGRDIVINRFVSAGFIGGQHRVLLLTAQGAIGREETLTDRWAITGRILFDTEIATLLRNALDAAIESVTAPKDQKPN